MSKVLQIIKIACPKSELRLNLTLQCGQSFRWREVKPGSGEWRGVVANRVWTLSQDETHLFCQPHASSEDSRPVCKTSKNTKWKKSGKSMAPLQPEIDMSQEKVEAIFRNYFQLDVCLMKLYTVWAEADDNFASVSSKFPGIRMLNQNPVENLFSFICSSNNNIQRISMMVEHLCEMYGSPVATVEGKMWYSFPTIPVLAGAGVEDALRTKGFGYRAKFIHKTAQMIMEKGGEAWLHSLRSLPYPECRSQLMTLHGVGAKVSDCICLMSMSHLEAIPVDTHVFQIAARDYLPHLRTRKTVTDKVYLEIGKHFRTIFGDHAGWAHSVLFSADLKKFKALKSLDSCAKKVKYV
ncbi:hypothetical protein Pcinc_016127 [Petrolisthes cinctipes]|uniref:N-glycosylase/DNA lyase n=1 Tax=Petrolisthes cinctipes TaxID=88211 RepID=A0AAE1FRP6_PETCI|nr:hypothetical protein Pcinc_016127 [Petrolisthes cinctipes]